MNLQPGQITRLVEVTVPDGSWRLAAEVHTQNGPVLGFLHAPANGTEGGVVFRPADELFALAGAEADEQPDGSGDGYARAPEGGTLTTESVPTGGAQRAPQPSGDVTDPNDPRGLRPGRDRRP